MMLWSFQKESMNATTGMYNLVLSIIIIGGIWVCECANVFPDLSGRLQEEDCAKTIKSNSKGVKLV